MFNLMGGGMFGGMPNQAPNSETKPMADTSEQVKVSALALLKMLKHCMNH